MCIRDRGKGSQDAVDKIKRIMQELSLTTADRAVVAPALAKSESSGVAAAAIQLPDGPIVTGKASNLMSACSSCVLNAIKAIAGIDDSLTLISPIILEPILKLKIDILGSRSSVLKVDEDVYKRQGCRCLRRTYPGCPTPESCTCRRMRWTEKCPWP